jgi:voltage-gated potassium channel
MKPTLLLRELFKTYKIQKFLLTELVLILVATFTTPWYESIHPQGNILNYQDAFWWAIVTITGTGFGEYYPVTSGGRFVGILLMFSGIALFSTMITIVASYYAYRRNQRERVKIDKKLEEIDTKTQEIDKKLEYLIKNDLKK